MSVTDFVDAPCGALHGICDRDVAAFMGIPFAVPPVGALRWFAPQALPRWDGTRDASRASARCVQHAPYGEMEPDNPYQSEDCLYLNVWTPDVTAKLPVIFWIHGGEFWAGSGSEPRYNGAKLAARGAVVVTINHRLGVFGFLSHPELSRETPEGISGNYGLLDQIEALKWTRANIAAFGGDPHNITIAGESAGSCSVSFLMATSLAQGLFQRAIGQSCAYFMPEPHSMKPLTLAQNEMRGVEFLHAAGAASIEDLRGISARQLLDAWMKDTTKRMQPCFDGRILPLVDEVFAEGRQALVPLLCGWNGDEYGFLRAGRTTFDAEAFRKRLQTTFGDASAQLLAAYDEGDLSEAATILAGDRAMVWPTWKWAEEQASRSPTFVYRFERAPRGKAFGATHASEIEYVFGTLSSKPLEYEPIDTVVSDCMGDYWVNFARSGNPNGKDLPDWPIYQPGGAAMHLDERCAARPLAEQPRLKLLAALYSPMHAG